MLDIIRKFSLSHAGTREDFKEEWDAFRFLIDDKMFVMVGEEKNGRPIATVKLAPEHGELLRQTYPEQIIPGYYMNKTHWNSVYLDLPLDEKMLGNLIEESYNLIFSSLSKKRQKEIIES